MITLKLTRNLEEIKILLNCDDLGLDMEMYNDLSLYNPNIFTCSWFKIEEDNETIGIIVLQELTNNCASFHGGLYKDFRHKQTVQILKESLKILHTLLPYTLITYVNQFNHAMIKVFQNSGLIHKTTIINGYKTGDMLVFGEE